MIKLKMNTVIDKRIYLNYARLRNADHYDINNVFDYGKDWPGDYVGRLLLALMSHYKINKGKSTNIDLLINRLPDYFNEQGYLGPLLDLDKINEQQLSGHSWLLRGLIEYYEAFKDQNILNYASNIVNNLFLPLIDYIDDYPIYREKENIGDVSGKSNKVINKWELSTDIGCAFISLDGLSHFYQINRDKKVKDLIEKMIEVFSKIDFVKLRCQTHATLSATRGIIRFYEITKDEKYLKLATNIFDIYLKNGMTLNYENYNWFDRTDSWTEPCAVVDSFIVAIKLYFLIGENKYKTIARRIYFNGLSFSFRNNGGAGPNSCATVENPILKMSMYEAYFCCSMRYAEGLYYMNKYSSLLNWDKSKEEIYDEYNRKFIDDRIVVYLNNKETFIETNFDKSEEELNDVEYLIRS